MTVDAVKPRRRYDNRRREEQALQARQRIVEAAYELFLEQGFPGTTMAAVARAAGVSVETVYKSFGTKAALAKKVWDVTLVGDDQPVPLARRPEFTAITAESDPRRALAGYAALGRVLFERLGPLLSVIIEGAQAGDPELRELAATIDRERLTGATGLVAKLVERGALRQGLDPEAARDILWTLISPEVCRLLVDGRGWSLDQWQHWLAATLADALLDPRRGLPGTLYLARTRARPWRQPGRARMWPTDRPARLTRWTGCGDWAGGRDGWAGRWPGCCCCRPVGRRWPRRTRPPRPRRRAGARTRPTRPGRGPGRWAAEVDGAMRWAGGSSTVR